MIVPVGTSLVELEKLVKRPKFTVGDKVRLNPNRKSIRDAEIYHSCGLTYDVCLEIAFVLQSQGKYSNKHFFVYRVRTPDGKFIFFGEGQLIRF